MSFRKIIVYQRGATKPIILTDVSEQPQSEIQDNILKILSSEKIGILETDTDCLIIRPSEIQSVLITKQNIESDPEDKKYSEKLKMDDSKK